MVNFIFRVFGLLLLSFSYVGVVHAQFPVNQKQLYANIFHVNGDTLHGPAIFLFEHNAVALKNPENEFIAFSPFDLYGFEIFEKEIVDSKRVFRSVQFENSNSRIFMEELTDGKFKLLKKINVTIPAQLRQNTYADSRMSINNFQKPDIKDQNFKYEPGFEQFVDGALGSSIGLSHTLTVNKPNNPAIAIGRVSVCYYILTPAKELIMIFNPIRDFATVFDIKKSKIRRFVRKNDLEYNDAQDLAEVVNFCNSL